MSEELTSGLGASPQTPDAGQSAATSAETPQPQTTAPPEAGQAQPQAAPSQQQTQQTQAQKPVNLYELPEFRQYQATQERRAAELQKKLAEYEAQMEQIATSQMDDFQRAQYQAEKYKRTAGEREQQLAEMQQQIQYQQMLAQRQADIAALAQEFGVPADTLENARTYDEARYMAQAKKLEQQLAALEQQKMATANRTDIGGGRANTPADRMDTEFDKAVKARDPFAYVSLLAKQQSGG